MSENILRVALYIRVSGEEQRIKGLSLEAQEEDLRQYAKDHGWQIAGVYIDAAKTARKRLDRRTEFLRMLDDVKAGLIDRILFTRLDRWFRNVRDYYRIMDILEPNGCDWSTTQEQYDTSTASGRLYINMKLAIAQNEADQTGERIAAVFDSKIRNGTVVSGSCPFGYKVEDKKLIVDDKKAQIVRDAFDRMRKTGTQRGTIKYIRDIYGVNWCDMTFRRMLREKLYIGIYDRNGREHENFCDPIIDKDTFYDVQRLLSCNIKSTPSGNIYIFSGLLVCNECEHKLVGFGRDMRIYYRCNQYTQRGRCAHNHGVSERKLEAWLLDNIAKELDIAEENYRIEHSRSIKSIDISGVKKKMKKLKDLYLNDLIDIEEYKADYEKYMAMLEESKIQRPAAPDYRKARNLLHKGFQETYKSSSKEERRQFWRSLIQEIWINNDLEVTKIIFL